MGSCYLDNHIARDNTGLDITTCNIEEHKQKYHLGKVDNSLLGDLNHFN